MPTVENGFDVTLATRAGVPTPPGSDSHGKVSVIIKNGTDSPVSLSASSPIQVNDVGGNLATLTAPTIDPSELTIPAGGELEKEIEIMGNTPDSSQTYEVGVTINFDGGLPSVSGTIRGDIYTVSGGF